MLNLEQLQCKNWHYNEQLNMVYRFNSLNVYKYMYNLTDRPALKN